MLFHQLPKSVVVFRNQEGFISFLILLDDRSVVQHFGRYVRPSTEIKTSTIVYVIVPDKMNNPMYDALDLNSRTNMTLWTNAPHDRA